MNHVILIGRLTRDPEVKFTKDSLAVARFSLAVDRPAKAGKEREADFPGIVVFGKQAETCQAYIHKGSRVGVSGRIQTGSYQDKDGKTHYTTNVVADRVEFLDGREKDDKYEPAIVPDLGPDDFMAIDEDIPF